MLWIWCDMAGPVEESAKVATTIVETMKGQPMVLALVIFNMMFAILVFLGSKDFRANQLKLMELMIEMTGKSQEMLSRCVMPTPPPQQRGDLQLYNLTVNAAWPPSPESQEDK
jgi:hypothetical protein